MNEIEETNAARLVLENAYGWAFNSCDNPQDIDAATVAILIRALELATPDLSSERRASLFLPEEV